MSKNVENEVWQLGVFGVDDFLRGKFSHGDPRLGHGGGHLLGHPVVRGLSVAPHRSAPDCPSRWMVSLVLCWGNHWNQGRTMERLCFG